MASKTDYDKCPYCKGDVKTYYLPPVHQDDCKGRDELTEYGKAKDGCACPQDSIMECAACTRLLDVGDYHDSNEKKKEIEDLESKVDRFIEVTSRPWK